ncbi:MAG: PEP-CTERM sorting domain-containing protein [Colwellia sp.]|nr:PEP-CTERM sorting domain-containing protein [Colwellia sp.]
MKLKSLSKIAAALLVSTLMASNVSATTITFDYNDTDFAANTANGVAALQAFEKAAVFWENIFSDDINVNLSIGYNDGFSSPNTLGSTQSKKAYYYDESVFYFLQQDATSADDITAASNFGCDRSQGTPSNRCAIQFLDLENDVTTLDNDGSVDNYVVAVNQATAKAMGIANESSFTEVDGTISFNTAFDNWFDFDSSDGIGAGMIDFEGVAIHEIGHALGFTSGVDTFDIIYNSGFYDPTMDLDGYVNANVLDLFRYSADSIAFGQGVKDFRPGADAYFSLDGGITEIAPFSTGRYATQCDSGNNDGSTVPCGQQASHWEDNLGLGIMDPTADAGLLQVTEFDLRAFDAIGWDLASVTNVPEPTSIALFGLAAAGMFTSRRRKLTISK